jgi:hypothetical protein
MPLPTCPDFEVIKFEVTVEGGESFDVPVKDADSIHIKVPENSKYVTTIHFKVKKDLKGFTYKQQVKKAGIVVKTREIELGDYEANDEVYSKEFPEDTTPGGFLFRGQFPAVSTYCANGEELLVVEWITEVTKK